MRILLDERPVQGADEDAFGFVQVVRRVSDRLRLLRADEKESGCIVASIEGAWGGGKTSFSNLLVTELKDASGPAGSYSGIQHQPLVVFFSAWQSCGLNLSPWEALAYRIGEAAYGRLDREVKSAIAARESRMKLGRVDNLKQVSTLNEYVEIEFKKLALEDTRLHWLEVAYRLSAGFPRECWDPCLSLFSESPSAVQGRKRSGGWAQGLKKVGPSFMDWLWSIGGDPRGAVEGAIRLGKWGLARELIQGPSFGVDTLEFARSLNRLLAVLRPGGLPWRLIVVVDDVSRMELDKLPSVLEALNYLREFDRALILIVLDRMVKQRLESRSGFGKCEDTVSASGRAGGESILTKLVNLQIETPSPTGAEVSQFIVRGLYELGIRGFAVAHAVAQHLIGRKRWTPREVKHLFRWLFLRPSVKNVAAESGHAAKICLLCDIYLYLEDHVSGKEVVAFAIREPGILLSFEEQPWDQQEWPDKHISPFPSVFWGELSDVARGLVSAIRLNSLAARCLGSPEGLAAVDGERRQLIEEVRSIGQSAWRVWSFAMINADLLGLRSVKLPSNVEAGRFLELLKQSNPQLVQLWFIGCLGRAARSGGLAPHPEQIANADNFLSERYFDADALVGAAEAEENPLSLRLGSFASLVLLAPDLATEYATVAPLALQGAIPGTWINFAHRWMEALRSQAKAV